MSKKTVLVTGSSRGIGKAIALRFAKEGYNIVINCSKNIDQLQQTKSEIEAYQASCLAYLGDVGMYELVKDMFGQIRERFGRVDVLINNAGIASIGLFTDLKPEDWNRIITTNLTSVYNCCSMAVPDMIHKQKGKIINISSVWGNVGASCEVAYSASKGGINAFTKALAKELAPSNIQVNAIACGVIDTEMNGLLEGEDLQQLIEEIPANRLGKAEEVADLAYQLSQKNEYLTGQIITLDGGWT
ncbi:MAG: SDR family oxidoreductase [Clostridiales bacterium]|nr:SDR family oxidoreductase [Clostridiales bacterium]